MAPLHHALLGMDYRSALQADDLDARLGGRRLFRITGMRPHPMNSLCKILWLRQMQPEVFRRARRFVTYADFLLGRLGAGPVIDDTMASRTMAFDQARDEWSRWILSRVDIDPDLLSPVVRSGSPVGRMSRALAEEIGLSEAPILVAGAHDQVCAALGAGVPLRASSVLSSGTAEVLSAVLDKPLTTRAMYEGHYPCYRFAARGASFTFALNHAGGILLDWLRGLIGDPGGFDAMMAGLPEGPSPVLVLPHFNGSGTPLCDMKSRGAIVGLTLSTRPSDITLAALEGLAFEMRINIERLEAAGVFLGETAAVGGGARSDAALQIKADAIGRPLHRPAVTEAASLGAAILAAVGGGLFASLPEALETMVPPARTIEPDARKSARYRERYALYRELHPRLLPIHRRMQSP
jgi:xylulokinase